MTTSITTKTKVIFIILFTIHILSLLFSFLIIVKFLAKKDKWVSININSTPKYVKLTDTEIEHRKKHIKEWEARFHKPILKTPFNIGSISCLLQLTSKVGLTIKILFPLIIQMTELLIAFILLKKNELCRKIKHEKNVFSFFFNLCFDLGHTYDYCNRKF